MTPALFSEAAYSLTLDPVTSSDLMTANLVSIEDDLSIKEAVAFLIDKNISGAPVIDEAGRPVGVLTQTDIMIHDRETMEYMSPDHDYVDAGTPLHRHLREDFQLEHVDRTPVRDLMTPILFTVNLDTPASKVVEEMLLLKVHRLFVVDDNGVLVGVITALDILRHMHFQPVGNSLE